MTNLQEKYNLLLAQNESLRKENAELKSLGYANEEDNVIKVTDSKLAIELIEALLNSNSA